MTFPSLPPRRTPTSRTPDTGVVRIAPEGKASRSVATALGVVVERLAVEGVEPDDERSTSLDTLSSGRESTALRAATRQLCARSRDGTMLCRVVNGTMILEGVPIDRRALDDNPALRVLLDAMMTLDIGAITIREGAAVEELRRLGRLLAQGESSGDASPRELMRTWSVLVTRSAAASSFSTAPANASAGNALGRLAASHTDEAATTAIRALYELLDDAERLGDAAAIEGVARAGLAHVQLVGESGGRLAAEGLLRRLLSDPMLRLLASQLLTSTDRSALLQLFARAGDAGVEVLVAHLMTTDDSLARRLYYDAIVAIDIVTSGMLAALNDSRWFVVRNAAALLGEMGVAHADDALIQLLGHSDTRIRIAATRALMRLRSVKALQALQAAIVDPHAEVRRLSAMAFGLAGATAGGGIRPPAARLSAALERESDEDVALEILAALGRIGSADAVQRLLRIALPASSEILGVAPAEPRESWMRIAALEALLQARGHHLRPVIDALQQDADIEVAAAAAGMHAAVDAARQGSNNR